MKRVVWFLIALVIAGSLLVGCAARGPSNGSSEPGKTESEPVKTETETVKPEEPSSGSSAVDSFGVYTQAKSQFVERLMDAFAADGNPVVYTLNFLSISMVDLSMWPALILGLEESQVLASQFLTTGANIRYAKDGNRTVLSVTDSDGREVTTTSVYHENEDWYTYTASEDGGPVTFYAEYRKTSYGYVAQYFVDHQDGSANHYLLTLEGEDGTVGYTTASGIPSPLTGKETTDFAKAAEEWYSIHGKAVTGRDPDGNALSFTIP